MWQILLFVGLLIWLFLVVRARRPGAERQPGEHKPLLWLFLLSAAAIGLFYGAGLTWGQHTHLSIVEYWRWWVVHLWVEGFFEVFATTVIAFFFTRLGLIRPALAAKAALLSATIFLAGGIIGTCHHLYFSGTPTVALALGSVFSALEVVPLTLVAYSALDDLRRGRLPVGAALSLAGVLLRRRRVLEYGGRGPVRLHDQPADRAVLHAGAEHDAAARARGPVRGLRDAGHRADAGLPARDESGDRVEGELAAGSRSGRMNGGLFAMCVGSLLPVGLMQTWASVEHGYWYARSTEFLGSPLMQNLRWMRAPGDTLFALGALILVAFVFTTRFRNKPEAPQREEPG